MELFDFLILAALALPAIFRWLGERSKKSQQQAPVETEIPLDESETVGETEFERALREISRALGGDVPEREPEPPPRPPAEPARVESAKSQQRAFELEDAFEKRRSETRKKAAAEPFRRLKLRRIEAPVVEDISPGRPAASSHVRESLLRPSSSRNAILFSEVLRPPLALRDPDDI
jgi:hypothetical protein